MGFMCKLSSDSESGKSPSSSRMKYYHEHIHKKLRYVEGVLVPLRALGLDGYDLVEGVEGGAGGVEDGFLEGVGVV